MVKFSAKHTAVIDDKGRVVLPAVFKKLMGEMAETPIAIEKDIYADCLNIYPEKYWNEKLEGIESKLNPFDEGDVELLEQFYENFASVKMAANGRINIPMDFMKHASLKKDVVIIGMGKAIRVWDAEKYEQRRASRKPLREMYKEKLGNNPERGDAD